VASMVPSLLQGQVDAILGSMDAYQIQLEAQGAELNNFRFADYGVPTVSTSIFASNNFLSENPDLVKNSSPPASKAGASRSTILKNHQAHQNRFP